MTSIPNIYLLQATKKHLDLAKAFQDDMGAHFFEHAMYDVKDALSSILALCDMADMKELPEVKKYIKRVNDIIGDVSLYHDSSTYNVKHVVLNVIKVIERAYKHKVNVTHRMVPIKAQAKGDQAHLERSLLYMIIEALEAAPEDQEVNLEIDLSQKDRDAAITLKIDNVSYSDVARKEMLTVANTGHLSTNILVDGKSSEVAIRLPLTFETSDSDRQKGIEPVSLGIDVVDMKQPEIKKKAARPVRVSVDY